MIHDPFVESTRYLARCRSYWWKRTRQSRGGVTINEPQGSCRILMHATTQVTTRVMTKEATLGVWPEPIYWMITEDVKGALPSGIKADAWRSSSKAKKYDEPFLRRLDTGRHTPSFPLCGMPTVTPQSPYRVNNKYMNIINISNEKGTTTTADDRCPNPIGDGGSA